MLQPGEIRIDCVALDRPDAEVEQLAHDLSDAESARAESFRFPEHRRRFIVRRASLRALLAGVCGCEASDIVLASGRWGRPFLEQPAPPIPLLFSLSHSHDLALIAIGSVRSLGIDVERVRDLPDRDSVARTIMSPRELEIFETLSAAARTYSFYRAWTQKEALLKARGLGLQFDPARLTVELRKGRSGDLLAVDDNAHAATGWRVRLMSPAPDFLAAIATRGARMMTFRGAELPMRAAE